MFSIKISPFTKIDINLIIYYSDYKMFKISFSDTEPIFNFQEIILNYITNAIESIISFYLDITSVFNPMRRKAVANLQNLKLSELPTKFIARMKSEPAFADDILTSVGLGVIGFLFGNWIGFILAGIFGCIITVGRGFITSR